jgi:tRNA (guanine37-N1)-methyltransferase
VGRSVEIGAVVPELVQLRDFGLGKHRSVDDTPYGGGSGMVLRVEPVVAALEEVDRRAEAAGAPPAHRILLSPQGAPFRQSMAHSLACRPHVALVCGRYEGFDERVRSFVHEEISLGDFVMTGGEVAAMAIVEATSRLLGGVLGNEGSAIAESHAESLGRRARVRALHAPAQLPRLDVPEVLTSGHHEKIAAWRSEQVKQRTYARRPDLAERLGEVVIAPKPEGDSPGGRRR